MQVPAYWRDRPEETGWVDRLPRLIEECIEQWDLSLGPMYADANVSFVAPAKLLDATPAVLKINVPDLETEFEADALEHWGREGAVTLLAHDRERRALLVERCEPGTQCSRRGGGKRDRRRRAAAALAPRPECAFLPPRCRRGRAVGG